MLKYDTPIEVTQAQYNQLRIAFEGIIAHRTDGTKYFIKVWDMRYVKQVERALKE